MQADPLQQLRDIHLPADPGWWPLAAGWWVLAVLTIVLLIWSGWTIWRHLARQRPLRLARRHLHKLVEQWQAENLTSIQFAHACNELLKRLLVRSLNQQQFAAASGGQWLAQLDQLGRGEFFAEGPGQILGDQRFQPGAECDVQALHKGLSQWLDDLNVNELRKEQER
ncbi:MAG: DUF4381 domain-containing protein [Pseudomonadota bacterium]